MTFQRTLCYVYAMILFGAAVINYIPGLTDDGGLAFGIFALDPHDDLLHLFSGLWALFAGWRSAGAARFFLRVFGALYLLDGVLGVATGWGYLDLGLFTQAWLGTDFSFARLAANAPHIGLGAVALIAGVMARRPA